MAQSSRTADLAKAPNETLRIAFVVNNYPPRVGGVELHVHNLARHLRDQGHIVSVFTVAELPGLADEDGIEVIRLRERWRVADTLGFPPVGATGRIARSLAQRNIDVVSIHTRFFPMSWVGLRAAKRVGAVVIHTEHGSDHVVSSSAVVSLASRLVDLSVGRYVLRHATHVLGVSERVVAFIQRLSGRRDAEVFYNAIEPAPASIHRAQRDQVVFVGRLVPGKGADVFVDTLALLKQQGRTFTAQILGDGPDLSSITAMVAHAGLDDHVVVRGRVDIAEVSKALAGAVLVNPSALSEGFQTTLLEALEAGGCVVSYDLPGAAVLRNQGFPVDVVTERGPVTLASAVGARLGTPWPVLPMHDWYWSTRARAYAQLAQDLVRRHRRH